MKKILQSINKWWDDKRSKKQESAISALNAEAVRVINIKEVTVNPGGAVKYGVFLSGNLVALYDTPSEELLAHLLQLRKMYVGFWQPEAVYKVR